MKRDRIIKLDGHKPVEIMSLKEKDEYFLKEFGMTFEEFKEKNPPMSDEEWSKAIRNHIDNQ